VAKAKTKRKSKSKKVSTAKNLVIVESPAKANTINKILGSNYQVEASYGHVRDLPKSEMGVDPKEDFQPRYVIPTKARKVVSHLKKQAKNASTIYLAPDPDREGEAICWHLSKLFSENSATIKRVYFNEITKDAVRDAFNHPREIDQNLVDSQQARRVLDRLVGYELSPLLWKKVGRGLSAGRVQSVALRIIVEREREIKKFKPKEYWSLVARLSSQRPEQVENIFKAKLERIGKEKVDLKNEAETVKVKEFLEQQTFRVASIRKRERRRKPQAPYTTSKLQQEAYNRIGFSAAKTMRTAQGLYEGVAIGDEGTVGLITYMRTDSVNIAESARKETAAYIRETFGNDHYPKTPNMYRSKKGAQEAHEAIRPTTVHHHPESIKDYLTDDQYKLYNLIWRKFVASQMAVAIDLVTSIEILAGKEHVFKASGTRNLFPGFLAVFADIVKPPKKNNEKDKDAKAKDEEDEDANQEFPELQQDEELKLHELVGNQHFTKPPPRFNDASLVKALEEKGIGRPSTYAPIIYTLVNRDYVERNGGALIPTEIAETVVVLLVEYFPHVLDVKFTALMEEELDKIEEGTMNWVNVLREFHGPFEERLAGAREKIKAITREVVPAGENCEKCNKPMLIKWGRFGKFVACSGFPDCRNTKAVSTDIPCPKDKCEGFLTKRKGRRGSRFYGCSKYPNCDFVTNKLPKKESQVSEEKPPEADEIDENV
jgi:DNA topoisomerase I